MEGGKQACISIYQVDGKKENQIQPINKYLVQSKFWAIYLGCGLSV